ncbi:hypothetical protein [Saccharococcus sp. Marseille-Q5394]|uniref:hypothetical protein n=1 Tax=Saccharococcus sp. Marseille-Q5394 TaxID=2972778 RepID=UPI0021C6E49F|nr:hypothetical protein [Saccharococcus sp. Marseille-Q5394]
MKKIISVIFTIMVLTACSETTNHDYKFSGESEHWEAEYSYKGTEKWGEKNGQRKYSIEDSYQLVLQYKGSIEELSSLQTLEYSFESNRNHWKLTEEYTEPPLTGAFLSSGESKGGAKVGKDEVIKVTVKWDDFEESFELHNYSE